VLGAAGEIVAEEQPAMMARAVAHLPDPHVVVPDRNADDRREAQAEQAVGGVERRLDDAVELEVRLDGRLVEVATRLAQLGPRSSASPTPPIRNCRPPPARSPAWRRGRRARSSAPAPTSARAGTHPRLRRLRHGVIEPVMGKRRIAERRARSIRSAIISAIIALLSVVPPPTPRAIRRGRFFAQIPPCRELQERLDARAPG
jgi:hypothetical protein